MQPPPREKQPQHKPQISDDGTWLVKGKGKKVYVEDDIDRPSSSGPALENVQPVDSDHVADFGTQTVLIEGSNSPHREENIAPIPQCFEHDNSPNQLTSSVGISKARLTQIPQKSIPVANKFSALVAECGTKDEIMITTGLVATSPRHGDTTLSPTSATTYMSKPNQGPGRDNNGKNKQSNSSGKKTPSHRSF